MVIEQKMMTLNGIRLTFFGGGVKIKDYCYG